MWADRDLKLGKESERLKPGVAGFFEKKRGWKRGVCGRLNEKLPLHAGSRRKKFVVPTPHVAQKVTPIRGGKLMPPRGGRQSGGVIIRTFVTKDRKMFEEKKKNRIVTAEVKRAYPIDMGENVDMRGSDLNAT